MDLVKEPMHGTHAFPVAQYLFNYRTGNDFFFYPHYHDELEFFYVNDGDAILWVNTIPHPMQPVILLSFPPPPFIPAALSMQASAEHM